MLELAKLNLDGIAGMRNGGGPILKAPSPFTYWGAAEGALPPRASSASRLCKTYASIDRVPHIQTVYIRRKGSPVSRRAFLYVLELAKLSLYGVAGHAERGLRPQGAQRRRGGTPPRAGTGAPSVRTSARSPAPHSPASIVRVPDSRPAARASASTLEPLAMNFFSPGSRAVPANATGDGA